ncbi:MAG: thioredoxin [Chloroflexi bacterium]|nr:thioredoxin [Chloroflexota bacterium]
MAKPKNVRDEEFEAQVLKADKPVMVDFWAEWCGPCKMIAPVVEELAQEYDGRVEFVKIDVDASPQSATRFGIRSIPTLLVFKNGKVEEQVIGAVPKSVLKKKLESVLSR